MHFFQTAIKALEQESCEDAELDFVQPHKKIPVNLETCGDSISRHDALERLIYVLSETEWFNAKAILDELPSVRPEQEPQLVIYSGDGYADGELVYDWAECPKCGYEYEEDDKDWKEPFCPHCGQALEWSEYEEKD